MSIFIGSNAGETIEPGTVSPSVAVIGSPSTPGAGADIILAGSGDDRVAGGGGNDIVSLGAGNDLYTWNSGDGNDLVDGGSGSDTLVFNGSTAAETITVSAGTQGTTRVASSADNGSVTSTRIEHIVISAGAGDDVVDASALPAGRATLEIRGGQGNDLLIGSAGNDTFVWNPGDGSDTIEGGNGHDTLLFNGAAIGETINVSANGPRALFSRDIATINMDLSGVERIDFNALGGADIVRVHDLSGTDVTQVNVNLAGTLGGSIGDGSDDQVIVDGTSGNDTLQVSGSGGSAAVSGLAAVTQVSNAEATDQLIVQGQGGNDSFSVSTTQAPAFALVFEGGDGQDVAQVNGSSGADSFAIVANGTRAHVDAGDLHLDVGTTESLVIRGGAGDDHFSAAGNLAAITSLTLDGGAGNDTILGGNGADLLIGGDGNDFIDGNQGNDTAQMGAGDDTFQWDPGDGSDIVEGGTGSDKMLFNGANIAEKMDVFANGSRTLFTRNIGTITMDLDDVERIDVTARGGADSITVHDLTGTDVTEVNVDLAATPGTDTGDGEVDSVTALATDGNDHLEFTGSGATASVLGLAAVTSVSNAEAADQFIVDGRGGNDVMTASLDQAAAPTLVFEGGDGDDLAQVDGSSGADSFSIVANGTRAHVDAGDLHLEVGATTESLVIRGGGGDDQFSANGNLAAITSLTLDGGAGDDTIRGGNGADLLIGGTGDDFIDGNQGNDTAQMGAGDDTFQWDPGDGSDIVEGGTGNDRMLFNGANIDEKMDVFASGTRTLFTRNIGTITMDLNDVERIDVAARGGADSITVHDLTGTDVTQVNVDLAGNPGAGDGAADQVTAEATEGNDNLQFTGSGDIASVLGLAAVTSVSNAETADQFIVDGRGGNDVMTASLDQAAAPTLVFEGGDGDDTAHVVGSSGADSFAITADGTHARVDAGNLHLEVGPTTESLVISGGDGDDHFSAVGNLAAITSLTLDGGAGNDTILGGNGADLLIGGSGNDFIDGNQGNDSAQMGAGDDTFQWDPGDGSDIVEGGGGHDTMLFNGANIAETMDVSANGERTLFTRNIGTITMDLNDVERIDVTTRGGADKIAVHDLTGTDVTDVNVDLAANPGTGTGDGAADQVAVDGTSGKDTVFVTGAAGAAAVTGLPANVNLTGAEAALDSLQVNLGGGNDRFDASGLAADVVHLTVVGGAGADLMIGSQGDDSFVWNPGDGSDTIEGQGGLDTMLFNGANIVENVSVSANGSRALFTRDAGGITMDLNDVERITFNALGGADNVVVNDLSGTDVTEVNVDLAQAGGGGDGAQDNVTVNATSGDDVMVLAGDVAGISVLGLAARVDVTGADGTGDTLHIVGGAGNDVIDASGVAPGSIGLVLDGGEGDDVIIGSAGDDVLIGGPGDDVLIGNGGNDTFQAAPGNDTVIQGFAAAGGSQDVIDLRGIAGAHDFAWVLAHASDVDGNAVIDLGDGAHVTLDNVDVASLHSDNFLMS